MIDSPPLLPDRAEDSEFHRRLLDGDPVAGFGRFIAALQPVPTKIVLLAPPSDLEPMQFNDEYIEATLWHLDTVLAVTYTRHRNRRARSWPGLVQG